MSALSLDPYGFQVVCKEDYINPIDYCPPVEDCNNCGLLCSLLELLPYGQAWQHGKQSSINDLMNPCYSSTNECLTCDVVALRKFIEALYVIENKFLNRMKTLAYNANPLTSKDTSYWLKKYGLDKIDTGYEINQCPVYDCITPYETCFECLDTFDYVLDEKTKVAIEHGAIKARLISDRVDFTGSLIDINRALRQLGYSVSVAPTNFNNTACPNTFGGIAEDNNIIPLCPTSPFGGASNCTTEIMKLRLLPIADSIVAPIFPCDGSVNATKSLDDGLTVCGEIGCTNLINVTFNVTKVVCGETVIKTIRPARDYALTILRKIFPVTQPYKIVEIV